MANTKDRIVLLGKKGVALILTWSKKLDLLAFFKAVLL